MKGNRNGFFSRKDEEIIEIPANTELAKRDNGTGMRRLKGEAGKDINAYGVADAGAVSFCLSRV